MTRYVDPRWLVVALLLVMLGLASSSAVQKSPTMDEQNHIARGAAYLGTGDPRLSIEHPPLVNVLSALPPHLLLDLRLPLDEWWEAAEWYHFADSFLWRVNSNPEQIVFLARLPVMGLGLLLVSLVYRWAAERFGAWGGLLAAIFCALDPNILAHSRLSTTDLGSAFFVLLAAHAFWRLSRRISRGRVFAAGLALGLAFAAKLSALAFGPILAFVFLMDGLRGGSGRMRRFLRRGMLTAGFVVMALLVVWASYQFAIGSLEGSRLPFPAPPYVQGIQAVLDFAEGGRPAYLLGRISTEGWWYYFPVAFVVKTPLPTMLGLLLATLIAAVGPSRDDLFVWVPPVAFFLGLLTTRLNLGYRHLLPVLPFLFIHVGRLVHPPSVDSQISTSARSWVRCVAPVGLVIWLAANTCSIYPHFLASFNVLGGGPENGWRVLVDSNIDWGQDLKELRKWMTREGVEKVRLSWFGSARPDAYGVKHDLLVGVPHGFAMWDDPPFDPQQPEPGVYAISVTNLVGVVLPDPDLYAWFRRRTPDDRVGYTIFVYEVTEP